MITVRMGASSYPPADKTAPVPSLETLRDAFAISPEFAEDVYKRLLDSDCQVTMTFEQYGRLVYLCQTHEPNFQYQSCHGLVVGRPRLFEKSITVSGAETPYPPLV